MSRRTTSRSVIGLAAFALAFAGFAIPAADAAPVAPTGVSGTCNQSGCTGLDPYDTNCVDDSYVGASRTSDDNATTVYLMYSSSCQAAWTEVYDGQPYSMIDIANNQYDYFTADTDEYGYGRTPMVSDPGSTRSHGCYYPADGGVGTCTNAYFA